MINISSQNKWEGTREAKAIHEAAHAIVGVMLGQTVDVCTIVPRAHRAAQVSFTDNVQFPAVAQQAQPDEVAVLERYVRVSIAGHAAEIQKFGRNHQPGSSGDIADIMAYADQIYPAGPAHSSWRAKWMAQGTRDVMKCMAAINELACSILNNGDQTHANVVAIMSKHGL